MMKYEFILFIILVMKRFIVFILSIISVSGYSLVYELSLRTNENKLLIQWKGPNSFDGTLYYNIYRSLEKPLIKGGKVFNFSNFEFLGTIYYSTNKDLIVFQDVFTNTNVFYIILPVSNGFFVYNNIDLSIVPPITTNKVYNTNISKVSETFSSTNLTSSNATNLDNRRNLTNVLTDTYTNALSTNLGFTNDKIIKSEVNEVKSKEDNEDDLAILSYSTALSKVIKEYFMKGNYKVTLRKLYDLRKNAKTLEEKEIVDVYISRCYYAMNKKRKSIYVLLSIKSESVKPIAEFWLNRFSRYFFGDF